MAPWFDTALVICVGDRTTERMTELGFLPNLEIIDMKERRGPRPLPAPSKSAVVFTAINEPGTISFESLNALNNCLKLIEANNRSNLRLLIEGEEDLLVLPVVAFFPEGTVVLYGQPNEGLVKVDIGSSRENAKALLSRMGVKSLKQ